MDNIFEWIQKLGNLINVALLITIFGYILKIYSSISEQKNATIEALREQVKVKDEYSIEKATERFRNLKELYEVHLSDWHKKSIENLEIEKQKAMQENRLEMEARVSEEIKKRTEIKEKYEKLLAEKQFAGEVSNFIFEGSYSVSGRSPRVAYGTREVFTRYTTYFGVLEITKTANTYDLKWSINSSQKPQIHVGTGIKVGNILSAVFTESNDSPKGKWYGIVSYEVVNDEILRGVWTGIGDDVKAYEELRKLNLASA